ncbi:helix-turn-helix domain-containing protein [Nonomuraea sp. NPDC059194]|uniref:helix-turn-helix domain-containing protein n=1 Tax=Nonomuraea sp. NPDC059194 TaxID=3346764 RepID=UPI0036B688CE
MRIRDLLAVSELGLTLLTGDEDTEFTAVHVTDLPEPGRYLTGGELVLSGLMWRHEPADSARFVAALQAAGVAALGAGLAWLGHVPGDLVDACAEAGLPLLEIPTPVSFRAVEEVAAPRLSGEVRAALGRQRRIVDAVAEGAGLAELFSATAAELGVRGAVLSSIGEVVVGSCAEPLALARAYLSASRLPCVAHGHTLFGIGRGHRAGGWVLACEGDLLGRADLGFELAACVALERTRMEEGRRVERRLVEQLVAAALAAEADPVELNARLRTCGLGPGEPYAAVTATALRPGATRGPDPATLGGQVLEELLGRGIVAAVGTVDIGTAGGAAGAVGVVGAVALVPLAGPVSALADRLRAGLGVLSALRDTTVSIGVSGALTGASSIRGGIEEAGHALRMAQARSGGVVTSDEIYTHALLLATVPGDVRRSFTRRLLEPLFDYDAKHQSELVRTLGAFLDTAGSWNACAERMHVHVNTVRYRIRRVEELTGRDLSTMADRVDFFLALRAR